MENNGVVNEALNEEIKEVADTGDNAPKSCEVKNSTAGGVETPLDTKGVSAEEQKALLTPTEEQPKPSKEKKPKQPTQQTKPKSRKGLKTFLNILGLNIGIAVAFCGGIYVALQYPGIVPDAVKSISSKPATTKQPTTPKPTEPKKVVYSGGTLTVSQISWSTDTIRPKAAPDGVQNAIFIAVNEWDKDKNYEQMMGKLQDGKVTLQLTALGREPIKLPSVSGSFSSNDGTSQGYIVQLSEVEAAKIEVGVPYNLNVVTNGKYKWDVNPSIIFTRK